MEAKGPTCREVGLAEAGFERFATYYRRLHGAVTAEEKASYERTIGGSYAEQLGTVRRLSPRPLLKLSVAELEELDDRLQSRAPVLRTTLKMFYRSHPRTDLLEALPRRNRPAKRKAGLDEMLLPGDVARLMQAARSARDRALIATLYGTGGRVNEILPLRVPNLRASNGSAWQAWFATTKVRGQERWSAKVEGPFKRALDEWLASRTVRGSDAGYLFPSTVNGRTPVSDKTVGEMLHGLAKKTGLLKKVNAHWFRHSRISAAFANRESDPATMCTWFWGRPVTPMANRYSHFQGLEGGVAPAADVPMPEVPELPQSPMAATVEQVKALTARLEAATSAAETWTALLQKSPELQALVDALVLRCSSCGETFENIGAIRAHLQREGHGPQT
jgi:site-specific recombinase XerD